jgi:hypothetical protein
MVNRTMDPVSRDTASLQPDQPHSDSLAKRASSRGSVHLEVYLWIRQLGACMMPSRKSMAFSIQVVRYGQAMLMHNSSMSEDSAIMLLTETDNCVGIALRSHC